MNIFLGHNTKLVENLAMDKDDSIRTFIAIDISDDVREGLEVLIQQLKPSGGDIKWVRTEAIHITLKFLGNIPRSKVPGVCEAMGRAVEGIGPFEVKVSGTGAFPNLKKPRVFWAGVTEETGRMADLAAHLERELKPLGFEPEKRAFKPHLTIGRVRQKGKLKGVAAALEKHVDRVFGSFQAGELHLFQSDLQPGGAVYTRLETVNLK